MFRVSGQFLKISRQPTIDLPALSVTPLPVSAFLDNGERMGSSRAAGTHLSFPECASLDKEEHTASSPAARMQLLAPVSAPRTLESTRHHHPLREYIIPRRKAVSPRLVTAWRQPTLLERNPAPRMSRNKPPSQRAASRHRLVPRRRHHKL